jgi:ABC-type sugar transport system substrate-binding protein
MRTIIDGSEKVRNQKAIEDAVQESGFEVSEVVTAGRPGASSLGAYWAKMNSCEVSQFPPKDDSDKAQQQINKRMAKYADAVIIVTEEPDALDRNLIEHAEKRDMPVHVHAIEA